MYHTFVAILQPGANKLYIWLHSTNIKLYIFTFAPFSIFVAVFGIITASCMCVFVLVCFARSRVRSVWYVWNILATFRTKSREDLAIDFIYTLYIDIFYKMFHGVKSVKQYDFCSNVRFSRFCSLLEQYIRLFVVVSSDL